MRPRVEAFAEVVLMARGSKPADSPNDGMTWLTLMPFPAFNPLNWWALASPRNAALATLNNTRLALDAWRAGADGMRAMIRLQQDEALKMLEAQRNEISAEVDRAEARAQADGAADETSEATALLMRPMVEATRAYSRVGRAFIVAQRDTLRAFAQQDGQPH
jgi:hypothetical protein